MFDKKIFELPPPPLHTASANVIVRHCSRSFKMCCHLIVSPYRHLHSISYKIASLSFNKIWSTIIFFNSSIEISTNSAKHPQSGLKYRLVIQGLTSPCKLRNFVSLRHPRIHTGCPKKSETRVSLNISETIFGG